MNEFALIDAYFRNIKHSREDVVCGIGDDAACLRVPLGQQLLVSCDTLVSGTHFLNSWDPYDIASRALRVNVSDMAAMGGIPCWLMLALTMPSVNESWMRSFSKGLSDTLSQYGMALIGGDTTKGPLSMTLTIHGMVPEGKAVYRRGAQALDVIYVSGVLGGAALAVQCLENMDVDLAQKLLRPEPRVDLGPLLRTYATAAVDISDGLSADLFHICSESQVGATLFVENIPIHPLLQTHSEEKALDFALSGGDDYELCFTVAAKNVEAFEAALRAASLRCYSVGVIHAEMGLFIKQPNGSRKQFCPSGYSHF